MPRFSDMTNRWDQWVLMRCPCCGSCGCTGICRWRCCGACWCWASGCSGWPNPRAGWGPCPALRPRHSKRPSNWRWTSAPSWPASWRSAWRCGGCCACASTTAGANTPPWAAGACAGSTCGEPCSYRYCSRLRSPFRPSMKCGCSANGRTRMSVHRSRLSSKSQPWRRLSRHARRPCSWNGYVCCARKRSIRRSTRASRPWSG